MSYFGKKTVVVTQVGKNIYDNENDNDNNNYSKKETCNVLLEGCCGHAGRQIKQ